MGRLAILSDLHADINSFEETELTILKDVLEKNGVTAFHLAGDTANKVERVLKVTDFFNQAGIATTFNFGNHEMADIADPQKIEQFPAAGFLNLDFVPLNQEKVLLGLNGWYDYQFAKNPDEGKLIRLKNRYWYDRKINRGESDLEVTKEVVAHTKEVLDQLKKDRQQVVIATHFVPQKRFIVEQPENSRHAIWNQLNAFLGAESLGLLFDQYENIEHVAFGHTHRRFIDQKINGTLYSCRPLGYYYEWQLTRQFVLTNHLVERVNPMKLRKILKDNWAGFQVAKENHLAEEFQQALTLINY